MCGVKNNSKNRQCYCCLRIFNFLYGLFIILIVLFLVYNWFLIGLLLMKITSGGRPVTRTNSLGTVFVDRIAFIIVFISFVLSAVTVYNIFIASNLTVFFFKFVFSQ